MFDVPEYKAKMMTDDTGLRLRQHRELVKQLTQQAANLTACLDGTALDAGGVASAFLAVAVELTLECTTCERAASYLRHIADAIDAGEPPPRWLFN